MNEKTLIMGKGSSKKRRSSTHTPSYIQADTLFTFTTEFDFLVPYILNKRIPPRYCVENIQYLKIPKLKQIAFPMKCFCDINLHRIDIHLNWYGFYGLAFSKEWGMQNGIQPIQYINPKSALAKDFAHAFTAALKSPSNETGSAAEKMQNYLLHSLMYLKPYEGLMKNRISNRKEQKCFTDECEWRYIPIVTQAGYEQAYYNDTIKHTGLLDQINNSIARVQDIGLTFEYSDLKYIILKTKEDYIKFLNEIKNIDLESQKELISKLIIWEVSRGDF